jgi:hypothetical protein
MHQITQTKKELVEIGRSDTGCAVLYLDKSDGSFWELNYPDGQAHGSSKPSIEPLSRGDVSNKYRIIL